MIEQELNKQLELIASKIKSRRVELKLTQEYVANISGLSSRTIQRVESGNLWLGLKQFVQVCDALQLDISKIFE